MAVGLSTSPEYTLSPPRLLFELQYTYGVGLTSANFDVSHLRYRGFRPVKRYIVFQVPPDTLGLGPEVWRVLRSATTCGIVLSTKGRLKRTSGWSKI